jgi:hypothetical protein
MNHERHRTKNRRAGCLACKPWKSVGIGDRRRPRATDQRKAEGARQELAALHGLPERAATRSHHPTRGALAARAARRERELAAARVAGRRAAFPGTWCGFVWMDD